MRFDVEACGARIKELRKKNGLTQEKLADALNITDSHLRRLENGSRAGSVDILIDLAEQFHVTLDYLVLGKGNPSDTAKMELEQVQMHLERLASLL